MLTMFIRASILYVVVVVIMRAMGKRQIGQLQPYELVVSIMVADLASMPMEDTSVPLIHGLLAIAALVLFQSLLSLITLKSGRLRELINGQPSVLIRNGVVDEQEMRKQALTLAELIEEVHSCGYSTVEDVGCAVLEVSGRLSVFPISQKRPLQPSDMDIETQYEGLPLPLILDGRVQERSLQKGGLDNAWLNRKCNELHISIESVFLCMLNTQGILTIQRKGISGVLSYQALDPKEVRW